MRVTLHLHDGARVACAVPYINADYVVARDKRCECSRPLPLHVAGGPTTTDEARGRITAPAHCTRCRGSVGTLVVQMDTLFGMDEDRAVLCGRPRVY